MSDDPYRIDIESIRRAFPPGIEAPPLLLDFAAWLEGRPWGSVGCFSLVGDFTDSAPIVDGSPLRDQFALFMQGCRKDPSSVAGTGSAGAPPMRPSWCSAPRGSTKSLPPRSRGCSPKSPCSDLSGMSNGPTLRRMKMLKMQRTNLPIGWSAASAARMWRSWRAADGIAGLRPLDGEMVQGPRGVLGDPSRHAELANHLAAHRPAGKNPWDTTHFEVAIAGQQYQVRVLRRGRQPVEEAATIEPILRALRDERWRAQNNLGLWYSMFFVMSANGRILPRFDYETRPKIGDAPADLAEASADLRRAPRPARWVPAWLATG